MVQKKTLDKVDVIKKALLHKTPQAPSIDKNTVSLVKKAPALTEEKSDLKEP